ncbi:MAG: tRNA (5-methylaminomethyl-2-thiouridine)(34)-methyltransferase MnmD [Candidatus Aphodosoma sp.]
MTIEQTKDGSNTLYIQEIDEHYHSIKGAMTESQHIFINCGLKHIDKSNIDIFEVGFGTGLNTILTLIHSRDKHISYTTIEKYPLQLEVIKDIEYSTIFNPTDYSLFERLHTLEWNNYIEITPSFKFRKLKADLTTISLTDYYDVIYFDAFSPEKQPEMWSEEVLKKIYYHLRNQGILVTYCAKGEIRRRMQKIGFVVERLAGPPGGKREILRGTKK